MNAPDDYEPSREDAAFVAWMLCIDPGQVFPHGPEITEDADAHLIDYVVGKVDRLSARIVTDDDGSDAFIAYRRRALLCEGVLAGTVTVPKFLWQSMERDYGRGQYASRPAHLHREGSRG